MESFVQEELPEIVNNGVFGNNLKFVSFERNEDLAGKDQYNSTVIFGNVITSNGLSHPVLVKLKLHDEVWCEFMKIDLNFHNEILLYEKIIPFMLACRARMTTNEVNGPSLPRYYYGRNRCGKFVEKDFILLENVNYLGYHLSEERFFLDYNHLLNVLYALAKFHSLSYIAKFYDSDGFREIIADVRDTQWHPDGQWLFRNNALQKFGKRGVDRLLERDGDRYRDNEHLRRFNVLIDDGDNSLRRALQPREPLSVLCHGDFNRNNLLFRYDSNGCPVDAMMFDFGMPRYGSPALDLSFLLYMNTTQSMRAARWDDMLDFYCSSLAAAVPTGVPVPDRQKLDAEMATSGLFGLAHALFYLPRQLLDVLTLDVDLNGDNLLSQMVLFGGEKGTNLVSDMVQHFVDMGYTNV